jgi:diguanylate cyclase
VTAIFGAVQFTPPQARRATLVSSAAAAAALAWGADRVALPASRPIELGVLWLYVSMSLVRFGLIAEHVGALRGKLRDKNRELETSLAHITHLAEHDALTDLLSRRSVSERLDLLLAPSAPRAGTAADAPCVALLDLDHFKQVNDQHGHQAGDEVLRRFAQIASSALRKQDLLGRWGGEEFVLVLPACSPSEAERTLERIHAALAEHPWGDVAQGLRVTVSAGVAQHQPGETVEALLRRADAAAYEAKASGRNRTVKAASGMAA